MRSQRERDDQTVTIATTLALFGFLLLLGAATLVILEGPNLSTGVQRTSVAAVAPVATAIGGWYLVRHRRP